MQYSGPTQRHLVEECLATNPICPPMRLADGSLWSVQASAEHYCTPRTDYRVAFMAAEVMVGQGEEPEAWKPWRRNGVYCWLPLKLIDAEIERRGGLLDAPVSPTQASSCSRRPEGPQEP